MPYALPPLGMGTVERTDDHLAPSAYIVDAAGPTPPQQGLFHSTEFEIAKAPSRFTELPHTDTALLLMELCASWAVVDPCKWPYLSFVIA